MPFTEMNFVSNQYGITLGILFLPDPEPRYWNQDNNEADDTGLESTIDFFRASGADDSLDILLVIFASLGFIHY